MLEIVKRQNRLLVAMYLVGGNLLVGCIEEQGGVEVLACGSRLSCSSLCRFLFLEVVVLEWVSLYLMLSGYCIFLQFIFQKRDYHTDPDDFATLPECMGCNVESVWYQCHDSTYRDYNA